MATHCFGRRAAAAALGIALLAATAAYAGSAGKLDPSFRRHSRVVLRDTHGFAGAVAVGRHNRIVVVGDNDIGDEDERLVPRRDDEIGGRDAGGRAVARPSPT